MKTREIDVAVIGSGTAGMVAYRQARKFTDSVVMIEGGPYGTTCARVGCMPSKLLIAAADAANGVSSAGMFGVHAGDLLVDGAAVMKRVRTERDRFVGFVVEAVEDFPAEHRVRGQARFVGPDTLVVDDQIEIRAQRVVIATGSTTNIPEFLKAAGNRLATSDDLFDWTDLPESVAVFGPGVIGLELGQALARLGVGIRMFGVGGKLGPIQDEEIREVALAAFNREFPLDPDADVQNIERVENGVAITFAGKGGDRQTETFDYLLAATGRRPNVESLDLETTGLELDDRGVPLFDRHTLQCGDSPIFIAGDVNNDLPLLHEAADEGRIAGTNAGRYPEVRTGLRRTPLAVVFTSPQIATAGWTIQQADERCKGCFEVGSVNFENQGRARVMGRNTGLLRVYGEHGSGRFLGAEMLGPAAEHIGHLLAWSAQQGLTVSQMLDMPYYHPVVEEGLRTALRDLNRKLRIGGEFPEGCLDCGPGS